MTAVDVALIAGGILGLLIGSHLGAGSAHYRHQRRACNAMRGHRQPRLFASLGRGPFVWLSAPLPGGFRLGHRL